MGGDVMTVPQTADGDSPDSVNECERLPPPAARTQARESEKKKKKNETKKHAVGYSVHELM
jgi:hypothetical protein